MPGVRKYHPVTSGGTVRKYQPSRVLAHMESGTKRYPKFSHTQEPPPPTEAKEEWETLSVDDEDVFLVANDGDEKSQIRLLAGAPISNSVFEALLAEPAPPPSEVVRASARPTVRSAPAVMVISEPDLAAQRVSLLLSCPSPVVAGPPPLPRPAPAARMKRRWWLPVAVVASFVATGLAIVGVAHFAMMPRPTVEASERAQIEPLEVAPVKVAPSTPVAKSPMAGPGRAKAALAAGDLETAATLFEELVENPSTRMDGLTGLAEISRAHGDYAGAQARYREMLAETPTYFPAKLGLADTMWDAGDKNAARKQYAALQSSYPSRMVPERVAKRADHK